MKAKETRALFQDIPFLRRFSRKAVFCPLLALLLCGAAAGAAAGGTFDFFHSGQVLPLFFSGIPDPQAGFFPCFSTLLLNMLVLRLKFHFRFAVGSQNPPNGSAG